MISVIGSESSAGLAEIVAVRRARRPSRRSRSPNSPMKKPGWARCAAATLSSTGWILSAAFVLSPRMSNSTSAECRSLRAIRSPASGRSRRPRPSRRRRRRRSIAGVEGGRRRRDVERLWIRTLSPAGCLKPASRILSMRPDSPGPGVFGSTCFVPTMLPRANATSDEGEPAEGRGLPVAGAPAAHAGGQVAGLAGCCGTWSFLLRVMGSAPR